MVYHRDRLECDGLKSKDPQMVWDDTACSCVHEEREEQIGAASPLFNYHNVECSKLSSFNHIVRPLSNLLPLPIQDDRTLPAAAPSPKQHHGGLYPSPPYRDTDSGVGGVGGSEGGGGGVAAAGCVECLNCLSVSGDMHGLVEAMPKAANDDYITANSWTIVGLGTFLIGFLGSTTFFYWSRSGGEIVRILLWQPNRCTSPEITCYQLISLTAFFYLASFRTIMPPLPQRRKSRRIAVKLKSSDGGNNSDYFLGNGEVPQHVVASAPNPQFTSCQNDSSTDLTIQGRDLPDYMHQLFVLLLVATCRKNRAILAN
jgi:hypothetical protein